MKRRGFSAVIIILIVAIVLIAAGGFWFYETPSKLPSGDIRHQCYEKTANLDSPIFAKFSSQFDIAAIQKIAGDVRTQNGVDSVTVISADDARQAFIKQQEAQGNQTVLNAMNELGGNPLESTLQANVKSEVVSSTIAFIYTEAEKYAAVDDISTMEQLKEATLQGILSAPDDSSSTNFFQECANSTSTVYSPADYMGQP